MFVLGFTEIESELIVNGEVVVAALVDGVAVIPVRVGHIVHLRPHNDAIVGVDLAVRISGPVGRVGLHLAVALHHFALVWVLHAP